MTTATGTTTVDLVVIGGGVAGLWILNRAVRSGRSAILLERDALGGVQTIHAQGIIHGGTKYALGGTFTDAAQAIAGAPARWRACLDGSGELDLSAVGVLSQHTWIWSRDNLRGRMTALLASHALRSRAERAGDDRPRAFAADRFGGALYRLDECVIDVQSLLHALAAPVADRLMGVDASDVMVETLADGVSLAGQGFAIRAKSVVIAAGAGYADIATLFGLPASLLQRRPLHMVTLRHRLDMPVFGHFVGASDKPLLTVTTHRSADGATVWYLGGGLAEDGVGRTPEAQIGVARRLVAEALALDDAPDGKWSTFFIDRAEPVQPSGRRPDGPYAERFGPVIVAWPTKLALAPALADRVLDLLPPAGDSPAEPFPTAVRRPPAARPVWERA